MTNKNNNEDKKKMYLDFTAYLYPRIGKRIKGMRKKTGCTLEKFVAIESSVVRQIRCTSSMQIRCA